MKVITVNKKAFFDYDILEKLEAGLELVGSEVKSLRDGRINLKDSYVEVRDMQAFLIRAHISPYPNSSYNNHEQERIRKLLMHRREIHRLDQKVRAKGVTIMPLRVYFNDKGRAKIEIGLARGKREYEKKQKIKDKDIQREIDRDMRHFKKS
jgi:SsrA-binding protein